MRIFRLTSAGAVEDLPDGTMRSVELRVTVGEDGEDIIEPVEGSEGEETTVPYATAGSTRVSG